MPALRRSSFQESTEESTKAIRLLVGDERVALASTIDEIRTHHHASPAVVVGVDGPLRFVADRTHASRAALIAPGFSHAVDVAGGRIAVFLLPAAGAPLHREPVHDLAKPGEWVELADALLDRRMDTFEPVDQCLVRAGIRPQPVDHRLKHALDALSASLASNVSIEEIAEGAGLSPTRLMTLAREQLGAPLREYRRWLRAFRVAREYASGGSLTNAALEAGYSSSAHLSAAVREQFGIKPSQLLTPKTRGDIRAI